MRKMKAAGNTSDHSHRVSRREGPVQRLRVTFSHGNLPACGDVLSPASVLARSSSLPRVPRKAAGVSFQFRDLLAEAATDTGDLAQSQRLFAHKNRDMTEQSRQVKNR